MRALHSCSQRLHACSTMRPRATCGSTTRLVRARSWRKREEVADAVEPDAGECRSTVDLPVRPGQASSTCATACGPASSRMGSLAAWTSATTPARTDALRALPARGVDGHARRLAFYPHVPVCRSQLLPCGQSPHWPPQPSGPHSRPVQAGAHMQRKSSLQLVPTGQVPQLPPQPLSPHSFLAHEGVQHSPLVEHVSPAPQVPHEPPQAFGPHSRPLQFGTHLQVLPSLQAVPEGQSPHEPPQPSSPHFRPSQSGVQTTHAARAASQILPSPHTPHPPPQPSSPHAWSRHSGVQCPHSPRAKHATPAAHSPHEPPQPSSPHSRPVQSGEHDPQSPLASSQRSLASAHAPHEPPQPSSPHSRPVQSGVHRPHWPLAWSQRSPSAQLPHAPPQRSSPHCRPSQLGLHGVQRPLVALQAAPASQRPHSPPQPSGPHERPSQLGTHAHWPASSQIVPCGQRPHSPPQPSSPQRRWPHDGLQNGALGSTASRPAVASRPASPVTPTVFVAVPTSTSCEPGHAARMTIKPSPAPAARTDAVDVFSKRIRVDTRKPLDPSRRNRLRSGMSGRAHYFSGRYGPPVSPQPHFGIGTPSTAVAPGCELITASRVPHSR